jgi:hypothetical protein
VTLRFEGVTQVELSGLNEQNVLFDVKFTEAGDGLWDVDLQSSYGLGGQLRCASYGLRRSSSECIPNCEQPRFLSSVMASTAVVVPRSVGSGTR